MARRPRKPQGRAAATAQRMEADEAIRRALARDRYAASLNGRVLKMLQELEAEIVARLAAFDPEASGHRVARLKKLKREVGKEIAERYRDIAAETGEELAELAVDEGLRKARSLNRTWHAVGFDVQSALATDSILEALVDRPIVMGAVAKDYWASEAAATAAKFAQQMQLGVSGGENISDLIKRVRGSRAQGYRDGIMSLSRRNAESLVRTSVNSIANAAHMEVYRQNTDVIEALQHFSVLDSRTTLICSGRHGLKWRADTLAPIGHNHTFQQPPLHFRCRSIVSAIVDEAADNTTPTFDEWFKSLSDAKQDELFGPGRAKLFREGRIGQSDLLSQTGRPLTLAELKKQAA